jgi:hypothetical protein
MLALTHPTGYVHCGYAVQAIKNQILVYFKRLPNKKYPKFSCGAGKNAC